MIAALLALASLACAPSWPSPASAQVHSNFVRSSNKSLQVDFTDPRVVTSGGVEQVHLQPYSPTAMTILWVTESPGQGQVKLTDEAGSVIQSCDEDSQVNYTLAHTLTLTHNTSLSPPLFLNHTLAHTLTLTHNTSRSLSLSPPLSEQEVTSQLTWYEKWTLATPDMGNPKIPMSEIASQQNTSVWSDPSWGTYYVVENNTAEAVQWDGEYYGGASYKNPNAVRSSHVLIPLILTQTHYLTNFESLLVLYPKVLHFTGHS